MGQYVPASFRGHSAGLSADRKLSINGLLVLEADFWLIPTSGLPVDTTRNPDQLLPL